MTHVVLPQVGTFLDAVTCSSLTKVIKGLAAPRSVSKKPAQQPAEEAGDDMDLDADSQPASNQANDAKQLWAQCAVTINNLAALLQRFGMRDQPDILRTIVDALVEVSRQSTSGTTCPAAMLLHHSKAMLSQWTLSDMVSIQIHA